MTEIKTAPTGGDIACYIGGLIEQIARLEEQVVHLQDELAARPRMAAVERAEGAPARLRVVQ